MGGGRAFLHRALVLLSLLILASGEVIFEEQFDGTFTVPT
jgi:calreticulin